MRKRKFLAYLLTIAMVISLIPAFTVTASAATGKTVSTEAELKSALETSGDVNITVAKDIYFETSAVLGVWCSIGKGNKTVDLNGHKVELKNSRLELKDNNETMFDVLKDANVTIKDSSAGQNGKIFHNGKIDDFGTIVIRDVFKVEEGATLNVESGTITTGRYEKSFESMLARRVSKHTWGSGIIMAGGILNVYGGTIEGSGLFADRIYCAPIKNTSSKSMINIYGGKLFGANGSPALAGTNNGKWIVMNGQFVTSGTDDTYMNGGGPYKCDASKVGVTGQMIGNWAQCTKFNKTPVLDSTDLEVKCITTKLTIQSATGTADADSLMLKYKSELPLEVSVAGGKAPYKYEWQIVRSGSDDSWHPIGTDSARTVYTIGTEDNGANVRCVITDAAGASVTTDKIRLSVFYKMRVDDIALTIDAPAVGRIPSQNARNATIGVKMGGIYWQKLVNGSWVEMNSSEKFEAGGKYRVEIYVTESDSESYIINPRATYEKEGLTINGKTVTSHTLNREADRALIYEFDALPGGSSGDGYVFPFKDVYSSDWFYNDVYNANRMGLIDGKGGIVNGKATLYLPNDNMTYAEAIKLAACMNQIYYDGKVSLTNGSPEWYQSYVDYAKKKGIPWDYPNYNAPIKRADYVHIFYAALPKSEYKAINSISKVPDMSSSDAYYNEILTFYNAGILTGDSNGNRFLPANNIKRSEVAAILSRMMDRNARKNFSI